MSDKNSTADLKHKAVHEFKQFVAISLYLAFFFCAVATYRMLLLNDFRDSYFNYLAGLINALVIAKVILIGEYAHLGKKYEHKPLLLSSAYKALLFGLLVFCFHIIEEVVKRLLHGEAMAGAFHNMHINDLIGRALVTFCTFVPFFAFREVRRVLGEDKFQDLFSTREQLPNLISLAHKRTSRWGYSPLVALIRAVQCESSSQRQSRSRKEI